MLCDGCGPLDRKRGRTVLILVLMEYALRLRQNLNARRRGGSLNPCFNGICSAIPRRVEVDRRVMVLILVLMEYALRLLWYAASAVQACGVLILVLMEYALRCR